MVVITLKSCGSNKEAEELEIESIELPQGFPEVVYSNPNNQYSKARFELGRKLFYEPLLSSDGSISCGSCHLQESAFSDRGMALSKGVQGRIGRRNSPSLVNLIWQKEFMWDGGVNHLEVFPIAPITDTLEMNRRLKDLLVDLNEHSLYPKLFESAYADDSITTKLLFYALAQFTGGLISDDSKYDQFRRGEIELEPKALAGYEIFVDHCSSCHKEPLLTDFSYRNNGLSQSQDLGRGLINGIPEDNFKFKVPSLRNVALTDPYMHDGSMSSLEEVIDHYIGLNKQVGLDTALSGGIALSEKQKTELLSFLNTLTDSVFINNQKYSEF